MRQDYETTHTVPSLISLAGFAVVFFGALALIHVGGLSFEPVRVWLANLAPEFRAGVLAALILGIMAIARIMVLLKNGFDRSSL